MKCEFRVGFHHNISSWFNIGKERFGCRKFVYIVHFSNKFHFKTNQLKNADVIDCPNFRKRYERYL